MKFVIKEVLVWYFGIYLPISSTADLEQREGKKGINTCPVQPKNSGRIFK
jgi:hypothetical protein